MGVVSMIARVGKVGVVTIIFIMREVDVLFSLAKETAYLFTIADFTLNYLKTYRS